MRVGLPDLGHTSMTLVALIGASFSMMPPCGTDFEGRVWRLIRLTFSTMIRPLSGKTFRILPFLAAVLAGDHAHGVVLLDAHHRTSGASETIFMNFLSRSSRATGPKMRVPTGSCVSAARITAALSLNRM